MTIISTWNVNGLRSIAGKTLFSYLESESPDILCLQEIKSFEENLTEILPTISSQYTAIINSALRPGYSGTAVFIKKNYLIKNVSPLLHIKKFDDEGRYIEIEFEDFYLINCYYPNGQHDHSRVDFKLEFSFAVMDRALLLQKEKPVILTGDFNTAHHEIDLSNPNTNRYTTGFLNIEREFLNQLTENFVDTYRHEFPATTAEFTWWSYRSHCREKNIGWRLDYFFASKSLLHHIKQTKIMKEITGSDHCPVHLILK